MILIDFTEWQKVQNASIKEYFDKAFDTYGKRFMTNGAKPHCQ